MKCEHCGNEEVSFHYTSNINGNITEKHLCSQCAGKFGIDNLDFSGEEKKDADKSFEELFMEIFGFVPSRRMIGGYGMVLPTIIIPAGYLFSGGKQSAAYEPQASEPEKKETALAKPAIDEKMKMRRERNILREQMRQAAEEEDFEKAAQLRDELKKLENTETHKPDQTGT